MEVNNVNGIKIVSTASKVDDGKQEETGTISFTKDETEAARQTRERIEAIRSKKVIASAEEKERLEAEIKRIDKVYENVEYTVNPDGSVNFTFNGVVNVEDFKLAFGIKDKELRSYLRARHDQAVENGNVYAVGLKTSSGDDYEPEPPSYFEDTQEARQRIHEELELAFVTDDWSTLTYSDGYVRGYGNTLRGISYNGVGDYRDMTLGPEDNEKIMFQAKSFK